jgi:prepilin-type processing-associated H-X9-DG protein
MAYILPQIEQSNLYNSIDFRIEMSDAGSCHSVLSATISAAHPNAEAASTPVATFICPSDGGSGASNSPFMGTANPASDSYAANAGWSSYSRGLAGERTAPNALYNGLITMRTPAIAVPWQSLTGTRFSDITDGLSNTAAIAERLIMTAQDAASVRNSDPRLLSHHTTERARTQPQIWANCELAHSDLVHSAFQGRAWISGWTLTAPTYMHLYTPNKWNCHYHGGEGTGDNIVTPSSQHTGGVNVAFGDGHIAFVSDGIEQTVWWLQGSRNDGQVVALSE